MKSSRWAAARRRGHGCASPLPRLGLRFWEAVSPNQILDVRQTRYMEQNHKLRWGGKAGLLIELVVEYSFHTPNKYGSLCSGCPATPHDFFFGGVLAALIQIQFPAAACWLTPPHAWLLWLCGPRKRFGQDNGSDKFTKPHWPVKASCRIQFR